RSTFLVLLILIVPIQCTFEFTFINSCGYPLTVVQNATGRNGQHFRITTLCTLAPKASCPRHGDELAKITYFYTADHKSATHATFINQRQRVKYGINLTFGFDVAMEIKPVYENGRTDLLPVSCLNSTCFGWSQADVTKPRKWKHHEASLHGSAFNITFCAGKDDKDDEDDYLDDIAE
ncbi:hypothetical protein PMAYCL1PPCAC_27646, partial [Pristionchus mayeri]